jgi:hypothetical protein
MVETAKSSTVFFILEVYFDSLNPADFQEKRIAIIFIYIIASSSFNNHISPFQFPGIASPD